MTIVADRVAEARIPLRAAPGPHGLALLGTMVGMKRDRLALIDDLRRRHGDLVAVNALDYRLLMIMAPEAAHQLLSRPAPMYGKGLGLDDARALLGNGLLTIHDHHQWRRHRAALQPMFQRDRFGGYAEAMARHAEAAAQQWLGKGQDASIPLADAMARLTLAILGDTLLGVDLAYEGASILRDLRLVTDDASRRMVSVFRKASPGRGVHEALERLNQLARRSPGSLFPTGDGDDPEYPRDEFLTLLLAGHETTAALLSWTWLLLSRAPAVERHLHEEVAAALGGASPRYADVGRLPFTRMVLLESLRLYPPVWVIPRRAHTDDALDGYRIRQGTDVLICVWAVHRHPAYWPDPDVFRPERFADGEPEGFLAFGDGARGCIGRHFGMLEATIVLATLMQHCVPVTAGPAATRPRASLTLQVPDAVALRAVPRPRAATA